MFVWPTKIIEMLIDFVTKYKTEMEYRVWILPSTQLSKSCSRLIELKDCFTVALHYASLLLQ